MTNRPRAALFAPLAVIIGPFRSLQELSHGTGVKLEGTEEDDEAQLADDDEEAEESSSDATTTAAG